MLLAAGHLSPAPPCRNDFSETSEAAKLSLGRLFILELEWLRSTRSRISVLFLFAGLLLEYPLLLIPRHGLVAGETHRVGAFT